MGSYKFTWLGLFRGNDFFQEMKIFMKIILCVLSVQSLIEKPWRIGSK